VGSAWRRHALDGRPASRVSVNATAFLAGHPANFLHLARVGPLYDKAVSRPRPCRNAFGTLAGKTVGDRARGTALLLSLHQTYQCALSTGDRLESQGCLITTSAPWPRNTG
jgi:hypothetical protein